MTTRTYRVGIDITRYKKMYLIGICLSAALAMVVMGIVMFRIMNVRYDLMVAHYEAQIEELDNQHTEELQSTIEKYEAIEASLTAKIDTLEAEKESQDRQLLQLLAAGESDFDILRKYWYVFKDAQDSSGLTVDLLRFADEQCKKWNVNPDWMWHIYWLESNYHTNATNSSSGAAGLGQVMPSTGKSLWENALGYGAGSFTTSMLYDPYVNIEITVAHIGRNIAISSMSNAIALYSADRSGNYYQTVVNYAQTHGITLNDSNAHYH